MIDVKLTKCYLLHGDIIGFSKIVHNLGNVELRDKIEILLQTLDSISKKHNIKYDIFSDTILAYAKDDAQLDFLFEFSKDLLESCIKISFPIRGAIVHGDLLIDSRNNIYGKPILEAHELEKMQDWIGILISTNIKQFNNKNIITYPVPKKSDKKIVLHKCIKWEIPNYNDLFKFLTSNGLCREGDHICWDLNNKITNTIIFKIYSDYPIEDKNRYNGDLPIHFIELNFPKYKDNL